MEEGRVVETGARNRAGRDVEVERRGKEGGRAGDEEGGEEVQHEYESSKEKKRKKAVDGREM